MNKKLGGSSFKFDSTPHPYVKPPPALSSDKRSKELILTMIFSHILIFNGVKISKIETNQDDSHGKADTIIIANDIQKNIQLTKLSLNDPLRRINIAEKQTNELLNLFPEKIEIDKPLNVYIYLSSNDKNSIPKGNLKKKKKLVKLIVDSIENNRSKLSNEKPDIVHIPVEDSDIKSLANSITINPLNTGNYSRFPGRNGIHINYEFDSHSWNENDLQNEITRIQTSKIKSKNDLLLIWADRFELLYQDNEVAEILKERFLKSDYEEVYFLTIFDRMDMFNGSWNLTQIKTKPNKS